MIELSEGTIGLWSLEWPEGNWLAHAERTDTGFEMVCRLRWFRDDKIFDSDDERQWFVLQAGSEDELIKQTRALYIDMRRAAPTAEGWELMRGQMSVEEFSALVSRIPGMHTQVEE